MPPVSSTDIRRAFVSFFEARGHRVVSSHALIPPDDPTLYFVNAGMVQFKDIFIGARQVDYSTAVSTQKCLRVSGKHNDLENVGRTARHHTFFEMLGNFSFGDYFKQGAIEHAWEFLTTVLRLPVDKLHVSVYPEDDEAYALWRDTIGVDEARIHRDPENFWSMGDTGPCGPCSEIHIDLGAAMSGGVEDVAYGTPEGDARYLELWNLVFMQYDRDAAGTLTPLPKPSIDTGAGLERLAAVQQSKLNNYDTDAFVPIIERVAERAGVTYHADPETDVALRVIADHSRATAALVADGIYPDNEGRGYVLRRLMRRAIRFGRGVLGLTEPFLIDTTAHVVDLLGDIYPELVAGRDTILRIVGQEEARFGKTINAGTKRLNEAIARLDEAGQSVLEGRAAFELYDTYGFPPDLTALILSESGKSFDQAGYDAAMTEQRERARAASTFGTGDLSAYQALSDAGVGTRFTGYETTTGESTVRALLVEGSEVPHAAAGQRVEIVTPETPFYAESGGQVGDRGTLTTPAARVRIDDTRRPFGDVVVHLGVVEEGRLVTGAAATLQVDASARADTRKNHSATHLMHDALRVVLGEHVRQRGSMVAPDRLRFDFSHSSGMTPEEIVRVEDLVNQHVVDNDPVTTRVMPMDDALEAGAIAFFEEKYGDEVRVLFVGRESVELCGGTHVKATGDIGLFKIIGETAISSGVRRVEAITGMGAVRWVQQRDALVADVAERLRIGAEQIPARIDKLIEDKRALEAELAQAKLAARKAEAVGALKNAREVAGLKLADVRLDGVPGKELRGVAESLRDQLGSGAVLVIGTDGAKVSLIIAATKDASKRLHAGKLVGQLAPLVGGRGGGRPDMAQAGGADASGIDQVPAAFYAGAEAALAGS